MASRSQKIEISPEQVLEQLRQMVTQNETRTVTPPPFEPIVGEPEPWSVPPPGGFEELRAKLRMDPRTVTLANARAEDDEGLS